MDRCCWVRPAVRSLRTIPISSRWRNIGRMPRWTTVGTLIISMLQIFHLVRWLQKNVHGIWGCSSFIFVSFRQRTMLKWARRICRPFWASWTRRPIYRLCVCCFSGSAVTTKCGDFAWRYASSSLLFDNIALPMLVILGMPNDETNAQKYIFCLILQNFFPKYTLGMPDDETNAQKYIFCLIPQNFPDIICNIVDIINLLCIPKFVDVYVSRKDCSNFLSHFKCVFSDRWWIFSPGTDIGFFPLEEEIFLRDTTVMQEWVDNLDWSGWHRRPGGLSDIEKVRGFLFIRVFFSFLPLILLIFSSLYFFDFYIFL